MYCRIYQRGTSHYEGKHDAGGYSKRLNSWLSFVSSNAASFRLTNGKDLIQHEKQQNEPVP
jgi:hypothetical protein